MQLMPDTADFIAQKSGGIAFEQQDLATPQVNIAYGSWYLRYLLDRYDGSEPLALAAYNAGHGTVDGWLADAAATGRGFEVADIPYPETLGLRRQGPRRARTTTAASTSASSASEPARSSRVSRASRTPRAPAPRRGTPTAPASA